MDHNNKPLYNALIKHKEKNPISFHVPGHKYGSVFDSDGLNEFRHILNIDATELSGLDDLHSPEEAILEAEMMLAELYGVKKSYFLVNGSTAGNLAMVMAACEENDTVLVQRNCHKSVLNALKLAKVKPVFLSPEYNWEWKVAGGVAKETVIKAMELYPDTRAIILTYPNYYGLAYDLAGIIDLAHRSRIPVLVDEAHGAHFILGSPFPDSAVNLGADIVVQSAHKTLPAMTMGSYIHFNSAIVPADALEDYLQVFQSSSPSYPIMASLDLARSYLGTYEKRDLDYLIENIASFKAELKLIPQIKVLEYQGQQGDPLKMTIQTASEAGGFKIQKLLEKEGIFTELADPYNVLFIFPLLKENEEFPWKEAAGKIKKALKGYPLAKSEKVAKHKEIKIAELAIPYKSMKRLHVTDVSLSEAEGRVSAEMLIPYPPGIPLLLTGEKISGEMIEHLYELLEHGARFQGGTLLDQGLIKVFK